MLLGVAVQCRPVLHDGVVDWCCSPSSQQPISSGLPSIAKASSYTSPSFSSVLVLASLQLIHISLRQHPGQVTHAISSHLFCGSSTLSPNTASTPPCTNPSLLSLLTLHRALCLAFPTPLALRTQKLKAVSVHQHLDAERQSMRVSMGHHCNARRRRILTNPRLSVLQTLSLQTFIHLHPTY